MAAASKATRLRSNTERVALGYLLVKGIHESVGRVSRVAFLPILVLALSNRALMFSGALVDQVLMSKADKRR